MKKVLKIGLTGGIGSGKSQVSHFFTQQSVNIIDADQIARSLFDSGAPLLLELRNKFGNGIFDESGALIRKKLGEIVFNTEADLLWLNQLTHPLVAKELQQQIELSSTPYIVLDIPLLIPKSGEIPPHLLDLIDRVLVIKVSRETQLSRLMKRDSISREQAQAILNSQSTLEQKLALADDIINNEGNLEQLESQVALLHNQYLRLSKT